MIRATISLEDISCISYFIYIYIYHGVGNFNRHFQQIHQQVPHDLKVIG